MFFLNRLLKWNSNKPDEAAAIVLSSFTAKGSASAASPSSHEAWNGLEKMFFRHAEKSEVDMMIWKTRIRINPQRKMILYAQYDDAKFPSTWAITKNSFDRTSSTCRIWRARLKRPWEVTWTRCGTWLWRHNKSASRRHTIAAEKSGVLHHSWQKIGNHLTSI